MQPWLFRRQRVEESVSKQKAQKTQQTQQTTTKVLTWIICEIIGRTCDSSFASPITCEDGGSKTDNKQSSWKPTDTCHWNLPVKEAETFIMPRA